MKKSKDEKLFIKPGWLVHHHTVINNVRFYIKDYRYAYVTDSPHHIEGFMNYTIDMDSNVLITTIFYEDGSQNV